MNIGGLLSFLWVQVVFFLLTLCLSWWVVRRSAYLVTRPGNRRFIAFLGPVLLGLALLGMWALLAIGGVNTYRKADLARQLGVDLTRSHELLRGPEGFPVTFFRSRLVKGMTRAQVHSILQHYAKADTCDDDEERYYYISGETHDWAFSVYYDANGNFDRLRWYDTSEYWRADCRPGLLPD